MKPMTYPEQGGMRAQTKFGQTPGRPGENSRWEDWVPWYVFNTTWSWQDPGEPGCTWIELLIHFENETNTRVRARGKHEELETVANLVDSFKRRFQMVVSANTAPQHGPMFGAMSRKGARLMPMGIKTVAGGIRAGPALDPEQAKALNRGLAMYRG